MILAQAIPQRCASPTRSPIRSQRNKRVCRRRGTARDGSATLLSPVLNPRLRRGREFDLPRRLHLAGAGGDSAEKTPPTPSGTGGAG